MIAGLGPSLYHGDAGYCQIGCDACDSPAFCDNQFVNYKGETLTVCDDCFQGHEDDHEDAEEPNAK